MKLIRIGGTTRGWRSLFGTQETGIVTQAKLSGPMPWVIAIMVALTVIAAAAGLSLRNAAQAAAAELSGGITVQIVDASAESRNRQALAALRQLRKMPGIASARQVPRSEIDALIEPWLGAGSANDAIPVPALIDAQTRGELTSDRITAWERAVRKVAPAARIDAQSTWLQPVFDAFESLQWLALALVALLSAAMAAAVLLAVRTSLGSNRGTIEVVHLLGGSDSQIASVFQRATGIDAAAGGAVGLALGIVVVLLLARRFASLGAGLVDGGALGIVGWLVLALVPVMGVILAVVTARYSVLRELRRML